jgi:acyl dehydratase
MRQLVDGPYFEDLSLGQSFDEAPSMTLTDGLAAVHQSIVGGRTWLCLNENLSSAVLGHGGRLAPAALVWNVAIGQSTVATHEVVANLFYRGVRFHHLPMIGDTLCTSTTVIGLRQNSPRAGRRRTGLAAFRIATTDQDGRRVLDFVRCAMLPLRDHSVVTDARDDVDALSVIPADTDFTALVDAWDLAAYRAAVPGRHFADLVAGETFDVAAGDVVSCAPELARLTLNVAAVHHDSSRSESGRLVYGGHTIALALHQALRCLPTMVTVVGWHSCDHLAPVREGQTIRSILEVERLMPSNSGGLVQLRSRARTCETGRATDEEPDRDVDVLDWRFVAMMA